MLRWAIPRAYYPHLLVGRRRCSSSTSSSLAHHSFTSKHVARDGRVFLYATVVADKMGKGQSALPAWQHACSLVKANPPTLAIVFISRPTGSSLAAVRDLVHQFSFTSNDVGGSRHDHGMCPDTPSKAQKMDFSHHSHDVSFANASGVAVQDDAPVGETPANAFDWVDQSSIDSSTSPTALPYENAWTHRELHPSLIGCIVTDKGRAAPITSIIRANADMNDDVFWLEAPDDEGEDSKSGSGVGDRNFDDKSGVMNDNSSSMDGACNSRMQSSNAPNTQTLNQKMPIDEKGKLFKGSFAIEINEPNALSDSSSNESENVMKQYQEQPVLLFSEKEGFSEYTVDVRGNNGEQGKIFCAKKVVFEGELSGKSKAEILSQPLDVDRVHKDSKRICNGQDHGEEDEETYMLTLCVANMPGVRATGFHSRTAQLPWLPDLKTAATTNHPHMVLLGTPGAYIAS